MKIKADKVLPGIDPETGRTAPHSLELSGPDAEHAVLGVHEVRGFAGLFVQGRVNACPVKGKPHYELYLRDFSDEAHRAGVEGTVVLSVTERGKHEPSFVELKLRTGKPLPKAAPKPPKKAGAIKGATTSKTLRPLVDAKGE